MRKLLAVMIFAVFALPACKKSSDTTNGNNTTVSGKLKRVSYSTGNHISVIMYFEYDQQNRVTKWHEWQEDTIGGTIHKTDVSIDHFSYNGNDDKPYRDSLTRDNLPFFVVTFAYDAQNRIIKNEQLDKNAPGLPSIRWTYDYANNTIIAQKFVKSGTNYFRSKNDTFLLGGNNIISRKFYNSFAARSETVAYTYDAKANPFSNLNVVKHIYAFGDYTIEHLKGSNNLVALTNATAQPTSLYSRSFVYSGNGYPTSGTYTNAYTSKSWSGTSGKVTFEYY